MQTKRRKGQRVGQIPYGFRLAADGIALEPHLAEQEIAARVQAMRGEGTTIAAIVAHLNAEGVPARGAKWHATTVRRLLTREAVAA